MLSLKIDLLKLNTKTNMKKFLKLLPFVAILGVKFLFPSVTWMEVFLISGVVLESMIISKTKEQLKQVEFDKLLVVDDVITLQEKLKYSESVIGRLQHDYDKLLKEHGEMHKPIIEVEKPKRKSKTK